MRVRNPAQGRVTRRITTSKSRILLMEAAHPRPKQPVEGDQHASTGYRTWKGLRTTPAFYRNAPAANTWPSAAWNATASDLPLSRRQERCTPTDQWPILNLSEHPRTGLGTDLWLITGIHHEGKQRRCLEEFSYSDVQSIRRIHPGLPQPIHPPPPGMYLSPPIASTQTQSPGSQDRRRYGPKGARNPLPINTAGSIVQFHWDREASNDQTRLLA